MRALGLAALAASCLSLWPACCGAAVDAGGSLALTSDDVYRGVSQTCGHPAAQGDANVRGRRTPYSAFFAGVWGSVGLGASPCGGARELDAYAGYSQTLSTSLSTTLTYSRYAYPGGGYGNRHLYGERHDYDQLGMIWNLADQLYVTVAWTPDAVRYGRYGGSVRQEQDRSALSYGVEWRRPLASWLSLAAAAGYDHMADPFGTGYGFWSLGLMHVAGRLQIDLAYFDTADRAVRLFGGESAGGRVSATLLWRF